MKQVTQETLDDKTKPWNEYVLDVGSIADGGYLRFNPEICDE